MKQVLFSITFLLLANFSFAQGQGGVSILNKLNCEIAINVIAVCPNDDCSEYSAMAMTLIGGKPLSVPPSPPIETPYTEPFAETPPCSDWEWNYAEVLVNCGGEFHYFYVGNPAICRSEPNFTTHPLECSDCFDEGEAYIQLSWTVKPNGDILIIIDGV